MTTASIQPIYLALLLCLSSIAACQHAPLVPKGEAETRLDSIPASQDSTSTATDTLPIGIQRLLKAYPEQFKGATANSVIWADGSEMRFDDGNVKKSYYQLLNEADLEDQVMAMPYPKGNKFLMPQQKEDPGRVRFEPFFKKMYGASAEEVRSKLTTIIWLPKTMGVKLQVTTVNGIDKKMQAISNRLDKMPHLHKYLQNPGGTFNWRNIAGTERISMHSFGMTIDVNVAYSDYWLWVHKVDDENGTLVIPYKNRIPTELVAIFEEYGFIWGGKWYHYDTMHFEYRPELF